MLIKIEKLIGRVGIDESVTAKSALVTTLHCSVKIDIKLLWNSEIKAFNAA